MASRWIEYAAAGIELLAVALVAGHILVGTIRYTYGLFTGGGDTRTDYERYRSRLGRTLLLGLEILVAADIVRTVGLDSTLRSVAQLGLLVLIRTFLSWSLAVELEGRWPWQARGGTAA